MNSITIEFQGDKFPSHAPLLANYIVKALAEGFTVYLVGNISILARVQMDMMYGNYDVALMENIHVLPPNC